MCNRRAIILIVGILILFGSIVMWRSNFRDPPVTASFDRKLVIVGGGHVGLITAALAYERARAQGQTINITMYEKNEKISDTTAANIWNSHTDDEIASVVPRGAELRKQLQIPFDQPEGILVSDVAGLNDSASARRFIEQVTIEGDKRAAYEQRSKLLLQLGHAGMALWKKYFNTANSELRAILEQSNFHPCGELAPHEAADRFKGYRIDLIYNMANADEYARGIVKTYSDLGYQHSVVLSPDDVEARDPSLGYFCAVHSVGNKGSREWRHDSSAVWRPGGSLDTQRFLPQLARYLTTAMGTYVNAEGTRENRFTIEFNKKVSSVNFEKNGDATTAITGLRFADGNATPKEAHPEKVCYIFAPGEAVGTLHNLGFAEPAFAGFAGASLSLEVDLPKDNVENYAQFNHYMEVHCPGTELAWQARVRDNKIFVGGAGTKAFYGEAVPRLHENFARVKNLLQLQMFNDIVPNIVSLAIGRNTAGETMTFSDLDFLVEKRIAQRWVGRRAVVDDGFPTIGFLYHHNERVVNAQVTTHLGSGGGSFSLIMATLSTFAVDPESVRHELDELGISAERAEEIVRYADSRRNAHGA